MHRLLLFLSVVTLVIVNTSCKKGKANFILRGILTDHTFHTALDGANVQLRVTEAGGNATSIIEEMTTDSDGMYAFTFPRDLVEKYELIITKENYFTIEGLIKFDDLTIEEDNVRDYHTTAKSWVRLRFTNTDPDPADVLQYIKQEGKEHCPICCPDTDQFLQGAIDTSIYCINDGNTVYSYYYWLHNTSNQGLKSVITLPFDTTEIFLSY